MNERVNYVHNTNQSIIKWIKRISIHYSCWNQHLLTEKLLSLQLNNNWNIIKMATLHTTPGVSPPHWIFHFMLWYTHGFQFSNLSFMYFFLCPTCQLKSITINIIISNDRTGFWNTCFCFYQKCAISLEMTGQTLSFQNSLFFGLPLK